MSHDTKHCLALYSTVCTVLYSAELYSEDPGRRMEVGGLLGPVSSWPRHGDIRHRPASGSCSYKPCIRSFLPCQSEQRSESWVHILWLHLLISGLTITNTKGHVHWFNNLLGPSTLHYIAFDLCYYLRLSHNKSTNQEAIGRYNPFSCLCSSYHLSHAEGVSFETLNLFLQSCITYICLGLVMIMIIFHRYFIPCSSSINAFIFI